MLKLLSVMVKCIIAWTHHLQKNKINKCYFKSTMQGFYVETRSLFMVLRVIAAKLK